MCLNNKKRSVVINMIMAEQNGVIGIGDYLPWKHHPGDMKSFKEKTSGQIVIMGRKTFVSLGCKPLPNRVNIVLTRNIEHNQKTSTKDNLYFINSLEACKSFIENKLTNNNDVGVWVIGGKQIYESFLPIADNIYVTTIPGDWPINPKLTQQQYDNARLQVKLDKDFITKRNKYFKQYPAVTFDYENFKVSIFNNLK